VLVASNDATSLPSKLATTGRANATSRDTKHTGVQAKQAGTVECRDTAPTRMHNRDGHNSVCDCPSGTTVTQQVSDAQCLADTGTAYSCNNGCGAAGQYLVIIGLEAFVPSEFQSCCAAHDVGYNHCGSEKRAVDDSFRTCLIGVCSGFRRISRPWCRVRAGAVWSAVWMAREAKDNFNAKQENNCLCH